MSPPEPETISATSDFSATYETGQECSVLRDDQGRVTAVLIIDEERGELVEIPPHVARQFSLAILEAVAPDRRHLH